MEIRVVVEHIQSLGINCVECKYRVEVFAGSQESSLFADCSLLSVIFCSLPLAKDTEGANQSHVILKKAR